MLPHLIALSLTNLCLFLDSTLSLIFHVLDLVLVYAVDAITLLLAAGWLVAKTLQFLQTQFVSSR